ncbi:hypothetical protein GCM10011399_35550 [Subtercola lobariae]|uniref:Uncharacterized protein n=2 Tax=Subtercola lobariae TaxID=1588641 RepID=A0A917BE22_9MICO|nr:hypothetical protein GCM10011399_35550 [Subtercola lobariae]
MVADHLPSHMKPRFMMHPAFAAEAGEQAIRRRDTFVVRSTSGIIELNAPDVLGALIAKGAANIVDQRDPGRHLEDAAVLLATIDAVGSLDVTSLSVNDRRRLRRIASRLSDAEASAWSLLSIDERLRGQQNVQRLTIAAQL